MTGLNQEVNWNAEMTICNMLALQAERDEIAKMESEGYKFMVGNCPMYDECGFAIVKWNDKRSRLYKSYKQYIKTNWDEEAGDTFDLYASSSRQELRVNVAVASVVANHLNVRFGDVVHVKHWVD